MSISSESIRPRRPSVALLMAVVAFVAVDLAALCRALPMDFAPFHPLFVREIPTFPNFGLAVIVSIDANHCR